MSNHTEALNSIQDAVPVVMRELGWDREAVLHYVDCVIAMEERRRAQRPHAAAVEQMEGVIADHFTFQAARPV